MTVGVPRRTSRRRFGPGSQSVVGVIEARAEASFGVPVPTRAGRYRLTAVIGQAGGRLLGVPATGQPWVSPSWPASARSAGRGSSLRT